MRSQRYATYCNSAVDTHTHLQIIQILSIIKCILLRRDVQRSFSIKYELKPIFTRNYLFIFTLPKTLVDTSS